MKKNMKKNMKLLLSAGLAVGLMCSAAPAFAADLGPGVYVTDKASGVTLTPQKANGNTGTSITSSTAKVGQENVTYYEGADRFELQYTGNSGYHLVLMLKGVTNEKPIPAADNIVYINQSDAQGTDPTFDLYPSDLAAGDYGIYTSVTGGTGLIKQAVVHKVDKAVKVPYVLGDVNKNGEFDSNDALQVLQHSVGLAMLEGDKFAAGDVNHDGELGSSDALLILQRSVGMIDKFPTQ